ncbi:MAG: flagellar protein FliT [Rhodanobacter sp.]
MNVHGQADLEQALQLGTQMLGAAREGDWNAVAGFRPEYDALLRQGASAEEITRSTLLQVQQQHQQLVELTAQARDSISGQLEQQRRNHRALNAYLLPCDED